MELFILLLIFVCFFYGLKKSREADYWESLFRTQQQDLNKGIKELQMNFIKTRDTLYKTQAALFMTQDKLKVETNKNFIINRKLEEKSKFVKQLEQEYIYKQAELESDFQHKEAASGKLFLQKIEEQKAELIKSSKEKEKLMEETLLNKKRELDAEHDAAQRILNERTQFLNTQIQELNNARKKVEDYQKKLFFKIKDIPTLSKYFADIAGVEEKNLIASLLYKDRPAYKAAESISLCKNKIWKLQYEIKNLEYRILAYENMFPILKEIEDEPLDLKSDPIEYDDKKGDRVHYWVKPTEYQELSPAKRNQLALERYWNRQKTNSEIGIDYEKSIGYWEYQKKGWQVSYFGIEKGFDDLGRDLICDNTEGIIHVVQCKCWSSKKEIHENHINQLFGTTVRYYLEHFPGGITDFLKKLKHKKIVPVFYTSTKLSETAKSFADSLNIEVHEEVPLKIYPMIKCNISQRTGERIYHLPFDQQYDNIKIDPPNEFIALTVAEAHAAGFRRAFRWHGS